MILIGVDGSGGFPDVGAEAGAELELDVAGALLVAVLLGVLVVVLAPATLPLFGWLVSAVV